MKRVLQLFRVLKCSAFRVSECFSTDCLRNTAEKMKFSIKHFFSKCEQICWKLRIWSHLLRKSFMENVIFCAVQVPSEYVNGTEFGSFLSE